MQEVFNLFFILLWGIALGFCYGLIDSLVRRRTALTYVLWPLGGVIFFFATAGFLFYLDNGAVGLYGFPVMALGFFIYLHFLRPWIRRVLAAAARVIRPVFKLPFLILHRLFCIVLLPLGWLAQEAGVLLAFIFRNLRKLLPKKSNNSLEEINNEVESA